jgi:hypothetical protein
MMSDAVEARSSEEMPPMKQWVYKATKTKVDYLETYDLAIPKHFLCRSAVETGGSQADRVGEVELGDIIHFFFSRGDGNVPSYGSFLVIDGAKYPTQFGDRIEGTALFKVHESDDNADMIRLLTRAHAEDPKRGYRRDPEHKCFTGWVIQRLPSTEMKPPEFDQKKLFPGPMINLWHYPDPELPRPKAESSGRKRRAADRSTTKGE